ncbi:MAG: fused MFS/spermidine synthase [Chloroflexota bacterium]
MTVFSALLLAFAASCATLVLELVAGRMLAPYIGASLYTWTAIIGVVLAGLSVGAWLGGRIADTRPGWRSLGYVLLAGGLCAALTLPVTVLLGESAAVRSLSLLGRIVALTTLVFLPPSLILGMATPLAIRVSLRDVEHTGRIVGLVAAAGTVGSLVGNFLTGFVLTAYLGVTTIVLAVAVLMVIVGAAVVAVSRDGATPDTSSTVAGEASPGIDGGRARTDALGLTGNVGLACGVVIVASFCSMVIELSASRLLAPVVGLSLYSWTGIIGAVLAAMALGHVIGGRIADRFPRQMVLGTCLFLAGLASLSILAAQPLLGTGEFFRGYSLIGRIMALTAAIFFVPIMLLGMISPQVIRLAVTDVRGAGGVAGRIYAWSTAGAILGTFATGWWLITAFGVQHVVLGAGVALLLLAVLVGRFWREPLVLAGFVVIAGGSLYGLVSRDLLTSKCVRETNYFCIKVYDELRGDFSVKVLVLDHLIHSYVKVGDPTYLGYEHEYVQGEVTRYAVARTGAPRVLLIGGGGYTYPRWVEAAMPEVGIEVVEIDPGVTDVNYDFLGLSRSTRIQSFNLDGRQYVHEMAPKAAYGLVVQDAVNDLSVPYHIMTKEYNDQVKDLLAPNGFYLLTVIDLYRDGQLLRAAIRTMRETFPSVQLISPNRAWDFGLASVWVVAASDTPIDPAELRAVLAKTGESAARIQILEPERLQAYIDEGSQVVLTDAYAPVDNLIAPLFLRRN